jgi:anaerobic magnesium-protoporphyrin IX monomethyl ester cyclase
MKKNKYKVLLIRPYFEMIKRELGFLPFEPLGLHYIWASLMKDGHEVDLYDSLAEHSEKTLYLKEKDIYRCGSDDEEILKKIREFKPDIVGISGMFYAQSDPFFRVAELAKKACPKTVVIGGGIFASLYAEHILGESKNVDIVVVGEGEDAIVEVLNNLHNLSTVKGIFYRNKNGEIIGTEPRGLRKNLDELPLPHRDFSKIFNYAIHSGQRWSDDFNFKKSLYRFVYYRILFLPIVRNLYAMYFNYTHRNRPKAVLMPHAFMSTSRGCPNRCSFCSIHKFWKGLYRMRSIESVMEEIDMLVKNGIKEIGIVDENFTLSRERTIKICKEIINRGYKIRLSTHSGFYLPSLDREVLEYMYKAGFRTMMFAIENGDEEFLNKTIKKRMDLEYAKKIIKEANEVGFLTIGFFIFGHPGETKEIMLRTLRYAFESGFQLPRFNILQPFPGTEVYEDGIKSGILDQSLNIAKLKFCTDVPPIETKDFTKEDVQNIHALAYKIGNSKNYEKIKDKIPAILGWQ